MIIISQDKRTIWEFSKITRARIVDNPEMREVENRELPFWSYEPTGNITYCVTFDIDCILEEQDAAGVYLTEERAIQVLEQIVQSYTAGTSVFEMPEE